MVGTRVGTDFEVEREDRIRTYRLGREWGLKSECVLAHTSTTFRERTGTVFRYRGTRPLPFKFPKENKQGWKEHRDCQWRRASGTTTDVPPTATSTGPISVGPDG